MVVQEVSRRPAPGHGEQGSTDHLACAGFCRDCGREHRLLPGEAVGYCLRLMARLEQEGRIDFARPRSEAEPRFSTAPLFGPERGKMFGVLVCRRPDGSRVVLRAFSGQYGGAWEVEGWVGPLFPVSRFEEASRATGRRIKALGRRIDALPAGSAASRLLKRRRRRLSRVLMRELHGLYCLVNFRGHCHGLDRVFLEPGIPTGAGDCCAPKLLNHAARHNLVPLGLAEFFWGRENRSATRQHGRFYPPCASKCRPLLGFLLCGLEETP